MDPKTRTKVWQEGQQEEAAAHAAALQMIRSALGSTPRARLTWLLDAFAYGPDPERLEEVERYTLWQHVLLVIGDATEGQWAAERPEQETVEVFSSRDADMARWRRLPKTKQVMLHDSRGSSIEFRVPVVRYKLSANELSTAQQAVREAAEAVTGGRLYHRKVAGRVVARLGPKHIPAPPTPRARFVLVQTFQAPLPDAAVMGALALVGRVPAPLLRRCPYRPDPPRSTECGRAFVGVKRQKWCPAHQEAAKRERDRRAQQEHRKRITTRRPPRRKRGRRAKGGRA